MDKIKLEIAGEISLSEDPGVTMRKWREIFGISQVELAKFLNITVSTISDYEGSRRKSPGATVIKRFVNSIFEIDGQKGGQITRKLQESQQTPQDFFEVHEFARKITLQDFITTIEGKVITNKAQIDSINIYGYTLIDSLRTILEMPYSHFNTLYGNVSERVFLFTGVSTGRSPMVVIRVSPTKPSAVVLHGIEKVDKLAMKISERERIPIIVTNMPINEIKEKFSKL